MPKPICLLNYFEVGGIIKHTTFYLACGSCGAPYSIFLTHSARRTHTVVTTVTGIVGYLVIDCAGERYVTIVWTRQISTVCNVRFNHNMPSKLTFRTKRIPRVANGNTGSSVSKFKWDIYRCVLLILYLCNFFISHYIPPSVFLVLLHGTWCLKYLELPLE